MMIDRAQKRIPAAGRMFTGAAVALALLATTADRGWAGSDSRKGTDGAQELRIPVGPRGSALGSSIVSDASGIESIYWNPAGLGAVTGTEVMFSHTRYFADQKLNYAAIATHLGSAGVLGFNAKVLSVGDVIVTTEDAPDGTGEILSPTFSVLGLTFARQFTDRVLFGGTANLVTEQIAAVHATGVAFDFGVQYMTGWNGLKLGMVMKNFGPNMSFDGSGFDINTLPPGSDPTASTRTFRSTSSSFELPSYFTLEATYDLFQNSSQHLAAMGSFQNNNFSNDNLGGALEWTYKKNYSLRASYFGTFGSTIGIDGLETSSKFDAGDDLYSGFALGAGAQIRAGDVGKLGVDVAWRPIREFFSDTVEFGLHIGF